MYTPRDTVHRLSLSKAASRGTSLITLYVPSTNGNLSLVTKQLVNELSTSQNIKSRVVRNDVQLALRSAIQKTKTIPTNNLENGIVICAGLCL